MRQIENYSVNILERTKKFAVEIIKISSEFPKTPAGFTIVDQLLRAATSIGANLIEAQEAVSKNDFQYKISFSLKEAKETMYWLKLVKLSRLSPDDKNASLLKENEEIVKILVATLRKLKSRSNS